MDIHTLIGSIGVSLLLLAFVLLQINRISKNDVVYAVLNFLGAALAMWSSFLIEFMPFVVLEGTWALVSLNMIIKNKNKISYENTN